LKIAFRINKNNRYSIIPLVATLEKFASEVETMLVRDFETIFSLEPSDTILAYSFTSMDYDNVFEEVSYLKNKYTLIAGGAHPSAMPLETLKMGFDYVFVGDGEENIVDFVKGERPKSRIFDGVTKRISLNDYPFFSERKKLFMPFEITRGCPFSCGYCQTPRLAGRKVRHRKVENVISQAKIGIKNGKYIGRFITPNAFGYGSPNGVFPDVEAIEYLLKSLKELGMKEIYFGTFPSDVRPESVTPEVLKLVARYCDNNSIVLGVQSGSNRVLKLIKRGHDVETAEKAIKIIHEEGFIPHVDFIFGFPFETKEDVEQTFDFIDKIIEKYNAKIHSHTFMPLPGTPLSVFGAGVIDQKMRKKIGSYALEGKLDGYWHKQELIAKRLEKLISESKENVFNQNFQTYTD
jgi:B12-binding domain/radical SAM domain protein